MREPTETSRDSETSPDLIVHIDHTIQSKEIIEGLQRAGKTFLVVHTTGTHFEVPAIEVPFAMFRGYEASRYYLKMLEPPVQRAYE